GNGEADPLIPAAFSEDGGVNSEQAAIDIDQRATGVAHVNSCVGLDKILVVHNSHAAATDRADGSHGDRLPQPKRIANRKHGVSSSRRGAVCKVHGGQVDLIDFEYAE